MAVKKGEIPVAKKYFLPGKKTVWVLKDGKIIRFSFREFCENLFGFKHYFNVMSIRMLFTAEEIKSMPIIRDGHTKGYRANSMISQEAAIRLCDLIRRDVPRIQSFKKWLIDFDFDTTPHIEKGKLKNELL